ncbi:MAG TPA: restriction endonuclease subunit S [Chitinophagales bacterium]|nr:restriction endonuclease subunit S [Chitinophagales bacterium]
MSVNNKNSNLVRLGDYIELCDERNNDGKYTLDEIRGISTEKKFIDTKANLDGVSLTAYKVVHKNEFAYVSDTSRRGDKIALALNTTNKPVLISSIYTTFRSIDTKELLPEYLYLFFSREEFDRFSRFNSWGSARETFDWSEFCRIQIPLPDLEIQQELVDTYNGLKALAEQNEALIQPLTQACQAYIVDCKKKYPEVQLGEYIELSDERNNDLKFTLDDVKGISILKKLIPTKADMQDVSLSPYKLLKPKDFSYVTVTSRNGGKISLAINDTEETFIVSSSYLVFRTINAEKLLPEFIFLLLSREEFDRYSRFNSWGSARETFDWNELCRTKIPLPPLEVQQAIVNLYHCAEEAKNIAAEAREKMKTLCPALVQKAMHG